MKSFLALCVVLQLSWSYGAPDGIGAFSYQDTSGNRYGGTYPINDGQYFGLQQPAFQIPYVQNYYQDLDSFFPEYFRNFESILQEISGEEFFTGSVPPVSSIFNRIRSLTTRHSEPLHRFHPFRPFMRSFLPLKPFSSMKPLPPMKSFSPFPSMELFHSLPFTPLPPLPPLKPLFYTSPFESSAGLDHFNRRTFHANIANQRKALDAARKAFDLTSNQAGYFNNLPFRSPFGDFSFPTFNMNYPNSAYAGGAVGPGFSQQIASINPENPGIPNINVMNRFAEVPQAPGNNFVSMSSRAYSVSSNVNGKETSDRGAVTTLNDNGKITTYSVKS